MGKRKENGELSKRATRSSTSEMKLSSVSSAEIMNQERPHLVKRATRSSFSEVKVQSPSCDKFPNQEEPGLNRTPTSTKRATRVSSKKCIDDGDWKEIVETTVSSIAAENAVFHEVCREGMVADKHSNDEGLEIEKESSVEGSSPDKGISDFTRGSNLEQNLGKAASDECLTVETHKEVDNTVSLKRRTRSSSAAPVKSSCKAEMVKPSSVTCDRLFARQTISKNELLSRFPGRGLQILDVLRLIGLRGSSMIPLFVYGGASTGKTSVILHVFSYLKRPFVYSSCRSCYNSRGLFESVLNQLMLHVKTANNSYSSAKRCDKFSDFVSVLRDALSSTLKSLKQCSRVSSTKAECDDSMIYLIFDNVEKIRDWDKGASLISLLFNLNNLLKMPQVGLIFISSSSLDTFYANTGFPEPLPIFFSSYTEDDLYQIFMRNQQNSKLYSSFLDAVLPSFCRVTKHVDELSTALQALFKKYIEPLDDINKVPDENTKRRLFSHLQPHIARSLKEVFRIESPAVAEVNGTDKDKKKRKLNGEIPEELDFHMSLSSKYLIIAAFLASRNPATLDAALFDATNGSVKQKRKRKSSETTIQKNDVAAQEQLLKGPGTFPLERLLAIFQCITSVIDDSSPLDPEAQNIPTESGKKGLMSNVLVQFSMLCDINFISRGGSCPLEGSTRYRCAVDEDMAIKVARSVRFPLSKYLYR